MLCSIRTGPLPPLESGHASLGERDPQRVAIVRGEEPAMRLSRLFDLMTGWRVRPDLLEKNNPHPCTPRYLRSLPTGEVVAVFGHLQSLVHKWRGEDSGIAALKAHLQGLGGPAPTRDHNATTGSPRPDHVAWANPPDRLA